MARRMAPALLGAACRWHTPRCAPQPQTCTTGTPQSGAAVAAPPCHSKAHTRNTGAEVQTCTHTQARTQARAHTHEHTPLTSCSTRRPMSPLSLPIRPARPSPSEPPPASTDTLMGPTARLSPNSVTARYACQRVTAVQQCGTCVPYIARRFGGERAAKSCGGGGEAGTGVGGCRTALPARGGRDATRGGGGDDSTRPT